MMAGQRLPGLIVLGDNGRPYTILPGSQVLCLLIPTYVQGDPGLARALDERSSEELCASWYAAPCGTCCLTRRTSMSCRLSTATLVFFMGLFALVAALVEVGVIGRLGELLTDALGDRYSLASSALL